MGSTNSTETWQTSLLSFLKGRGKIQQLAELTAVQDLATRVRENQRNSEAEAAFVRKQVWGQTQTPGESESNDEEEGGVGTTILGDVTHPAPVIIQQGKDSGNLGQIVAAAALAALIPTAGLGVVGGYLATKALTKPATIEQPVAPGYEDQTVEFGLGRIEDYE